MPDFIDKLTTSWAKQDSLLCVGLDPDFGKIPAKLRRSRTPLLDFGREIVDATANWACAYKPQFAHYAAVGAEAELAETIAYIQAKYPEIPVILDAKRGDIGSTARYYAQEAFVRYHADAVTLNPYLGGDTLTPFLDYRGASGETKGVFILCRTSNPGSGEIQNLTGDRQSVAEFVAHRASHQWNQHRNAGLVVGATQASEIGKIRAIAAELPLLIPGVGAQGGDLGAALKYGLNARGTGVLINVSRGILYPGDEKNEKTALKTATKKDFAAAAAQAAEGYWRQINALRSRVVATGD